MVYLIVFLTAAAVIGGGLIAVGDGVGKTRKMPRQVILDVEEAIEFCAEALPVEVSSVVSYDELRRIMRLHLEWLQAYHWAPEGQGDDPIVFEEFDSLDYVMERAEVIRLDVSREHVEKVISVHTSYLQVMGAIHLDDPALVEADLAEVPLLAFDETPLLADESGAADEE